jgi:hypothetical protein
MENVGMFCDHLEYFTAIWYNLWPFDIICGNLDYCSPFVIFGQRKIWQPCYLQILQTWWASPSVHIYPLNYRDTCTCTFLAPVHSYS